MLVIYLAIKHFHPFIEGRTFTVFIDHKPLTYSLSMSTDKYTPRQIRHLDYISQFTMNITHISGCQNSVVDALSRITANAISVHPHIDFTEIVNAQKGDAE